MRVNYTVFSCKLTLNCLNWCLHKGFLPIHLNSKLTMNLFWTFNFDFLLLKLLSKTVNVRLNIDSCYRLKAFFCISFNSMQTRNKNNSWRPQGVDCFRIYFVWKVKFWITWLTSYSCFHRVRSIIFSWSIFFRKRVDKLLLQSRSWGFINIEY